MSKQKPRSSKKRPRQGARTCAAEKGPPEKEPEKKASKRHVPSSAAIRETIESVVIAFVLAFLFRTFEAEAFVIPTGSMAPTLMGRHKDLECDACGFAYQASASFEVNNDTGALKAPFEDYQVHQATCPMCRFSMKLGIGPAASKKYPSFKGDRILVEKFAYQFDDPQRWDVAVFKFPEGAKTNFIKRLVGMPNEVIRIRGGDIYTSPIPMPGESPQWTIQRKPPDKLLTMLQPEFDNDLTKRIRDYGWKPRWRERLDKDANSKRAWSSSDDGTSFALDAAGSGPRWLRYQHRVPSVLDWKESQRQINEQQDPKVDPKPRLIADFSAYNTGRARALGVGPDTTGRHWVGDLALQCTLHVQSEAGQVVLELVEGGWRMLCRIDVASGEATLAILPPEGTSETFPPAKTADGKPYQPKKGETGIRGPGRHDVVFANCDDQLLLWVDGEPVTFNTSTCYAELDNRMPRGTAAPTGDLAPVGIAGEGVKLGVSHLRVLRDIYYIAVRNAGAGPHHNGGVMMDFRDPPGQDYLTDPQTWPVTFRPNNLNEVEFTLEEDRFFALGDNSAESKDSRLWRKDHQYVERRLLIGKALFIYWPHSWDKLAGTNIPFPFFPNVSRMEFVR